MFNVNPFATVSTSVEPVVMQAYVVAMMVFVAAGTLYDMNHKRSARYFFDNWRAANGRSKRAVGTGEKASLAIRTVAIEVLAAGEFCNARRRMAHLLTMYGFLAYAITTFIMVFWYPTPDVETPVILPRLWHIGALMVFVGCTWFWFFIRVDVSSEGHSPFRVVRADLFVLSLLASMTFALIWSWLQNAGSEWSDEAFGLYLIATTSSVRIGRMVEILPHVLQAGSRLPAARGGGGRIVGQPSAACGSAREFRQRAPATAALLVSSTGTRSKMPTFVYMTSCDGCGHCVDICPSDIMHIDTTYRRAYNIEPNMCWECYACVKACPQNAIDVRGYADFAPLGHSVRVLREEKKGVVSWKVKFRDGREKNFVSPIRTTPWGSIKGPADYDKPSAEDFKAQELAHEPDALNVDRLPALTRDRLKQGVL